MYLIGCMVKNKHREIYDILTKKVSVFVFFTKKTAYSVFLILHMLLRKHLPLTVE